MAAPGLTPGGMKARLLALMTLSGQSISTLIERADPSGERPDHSWASALYTLVSRGMVTRVPTAHRPLLFALTARGEATLEELWAVQEAAAKEAARMSQEAA